MTDHITLPRAVVEQALEFLEKGDFLYPAELSDNFRDALDQRTMAAPVQEPVAWQDTTKPTELVSAEEWEYIDPMWHWMYRPLYTSTPDHTAEIERAVAAEREACALVCEAEAEKWEGDDGPVSAEARLCAIAIRARGKV